MDTIEIEILEDGTIKTTTPSISGANHINAENLMGFLATATGDKGTRHRHGKGHHHTHAQEHTTTKQ